jgi:hypothetical protein
METKKDVKKTKAPAMKAPKANPELEALKAALVEKEIINTALNNEIKVLEAQLHSHQAMLEELWEEIEAHKNASFFTKLNNLFRK